MKEQINLNNRKINYTLKISKRARNIRLYVHADKGLVVTIPKKININFAYDFIEKNSDWIVNKLDYFRKFRDRFLGREKTRNFARHKEDALTFINDRLQFFNKNYGFNFNKVAVRNQKTRWGSCSMRGNLNFNYRIIFLPQKIADYIIVHELCHLGEFNHSRKFWDLVAETIPDYLDMRISLKRLGSSIF